MQTYTQTFASAQTWELNVPGKFFTVIASTNAVTIRLYLGGKLLDLGQIKNIMAGIEIGGADQGVVFDRVQIDVAAGDTVTVGIGNGQARYNRGNASVTVVANKLATSATMTPTNTAVTVAAVQLLAANASRGYVFIQNKDASLGIFIGFSAGMTQALAIYVPPGGYWEPASVPTGAIYAMSPNGANANVLTLEG